MELFSNITKSIEAGKLAILTLLVVTNGFFAAEAKAESSIRVGPIRRQHTDKILEWNAPVTSSVQITTNKIYWGYCKLTLADGTTEEGVEERRFFFFQAATPTGDVIPDTYMAIMSTRSTRLDGFSREKLGIQDYTLEMRVYEIDEKLYNQCEGYKRDAVKEMCISGKAKLIAETKLTGSTDEKKWINNQNY